MTAPPGYVLVVEDDADLAAIMTLALATAGYAAKTAQDGREALDMLDQEMAALILLDMNMPKMNGEQFLAIFRERHGHVAPVVVVTAAEHARHDAAQIGADDALTKPFELPTFLKTVGRFLGDGDGDGDGDLDRDQGLRGSSFRTPAPSPSRHRPR